jgi:glyoxylase I family protein
MTAVRYMVDDVCAAAAFYIERLGFVERQDWGPIIVLARGDLELWLSGPGTSAARHPKQGNRIVIGVDDLDAALALAPETQVVDGQAGRWALVEDPAGNLIELFEAS